MARRQLMELGFGRGAVEQRLAVGRLHRVHIGVYSVGHRTLTQRGRSIAALLACGPGALLSHRSAADLWDLRASEGTGVDVTVPGRRGSERPGIRLHRPRALHPVDRTRRHGIPVTTVARTMLDIAEVVNARRLERALEQAERLRLLDLRAIEDVLARSPGRRGVRPLRELLGPLELPALDARSELERRFVDLCRDAGLPPPALNVSVEGYEVDAFWPSQRLIVELDGFAFHRTRKAFEADRTRDAALQLAGYRVLRITYRRLVSDANAVVAMLRRALG